MSFSVLCVIRGKLGDTLAAFAAVQGLQVQHPDWQICVLTRSNYLPLLRHETGIAVQGFEHRLDLYRRLVTWWVTGKRFDALAVLWGFGPAIETIGHWVRARRKIYFRATPSGLFDTTVDVPPAVQLVETPWHVLRALSPDLAKPTRLAQPGLRCHVQTLAQPGARAIAVVPVADEARRTLSISAVRMMIAHAQQHWPQHAIWLLLNPNDRFVGPMLGQSWPTGIEVKSFPSLDDLLRLYAQVDAVIGTDTGLYHLAAALSIPTTIFFGPTEPEKVVLDAQALVQPLRLAALAGQHCEVKTCADPICIERIVAQYAGATAVAALERAPVDCPLRRAAIKSTPAPPTPAPA